MSTLSKFFSTSVIMALLAEDCTRHDTVRDGDTCNKVCVRNHVPYHQLRIYNPWINGGCTNLHKGDFLCLAKRPGDCGVEHTHVVKSGESCWSISQAYHVNMQVFLDNNGLTTSTCNTQLLAGQSVCVNQNHIPYPRGLDELD